MSGKVLAARGRSATELPLLRDILSPSNVSGLLKLGARSASSLAQAALDRVDEAFGNALPRTAEQLARANVLDTLLQTGAPEGGGVMPPIRAVRLPGIEFESSNCTNFLIEVEFEEEATRGDILPKRLYAKLPCSDVGTAAFANAVGFWELETLFCARIASHVSVRVPKVYAVARRGGRFVLLLENLQELPGIQLFTNRDMAIGTTPERSRRCIRAFAELHAGFWGWSAKQREDLLPSRLHTFLAPERRETIRALNAAAIAPAHRAAPDVFTKHHVDIYRLAIEKWDALVETWYSGPLTLAHGDSHLANCFEYSTPQGSQIGLLDFQGLQWCKGIRDVQYHLTLSLEPNVLEECESEMIQFYVDQLAKRGIHVEASDANDQYRGLSFQALSAAVVPLGLGPLTERDETVRTILRRSVAAIDRLSFGDWLSSL